MKEFIVGSIEFGPAKPPSYKTDISITAPQAIPLIINSHIPPTPTNKLIIELLELMLSSLFDMQHQTAASSPDKLVKATSKLVELKKALS